MIRVRTIIVAALLLAGTATADEAPADFTTDGCSLFPDGSPIQPNLWCDCCVAHDMAYWRGGTEEERRQADEALRHCVEQRTGNKGFAELVYAGVRAGGLPVFPTWYRWGYGWPYGRGHKALSEAEASTAEAKLQAYRNAHPVLTCDNERVPPTEGMSSAGQPSDGPPLPEILEFP